MDKQRAAAVYLGIVGGGALFWFVNNVSHDARAGYAADGFRGAVEQSTVTVTNFGLRLSVDLIDVCVGLAAVAAVALAVWVHRLTVGTERRGEEHGSARWGKSADIAGFMNRKEPARNLLLTKTERLNLDRPARPEFQRNHNVMCIGAAGSGKSRFFILPNSVNAQTSFLVTDPKGELLQESGRVLVEQGYKIRVLNLDYFAASDQFNAFAYLRPGHEPEDVGLMVRNIMSNTDGDHKVAAGGDPLWEKAEAALLNALVAFVAASYDLAEQNLGTVVDLLGQMQASEHGQVSPVDVLFEEAEGLLASGASAPRRELLSYAVANYRIYAQAAAKTASSIIVSAGVRLAPLLIPAVRRLVSRDTLELDMVGFEKTALFMVISNTDRQFNWLASLVFTMFFQRAVFLADQQMDHRLPMPLLCLMDEFANIGRIPNFEILAATLRGRGIGFVAVVQAIGQGQAVYRDGWKSILGNCDSVLFLGSADPETRKFVSEALGRQTISTTDSSSTRGRNGSSSRSRKSLGRELLTADEVGWIPGDEAILMIRGLPPFRSKRLDPIPAAVPYRHAVGLTQGWM